MRHLANRLAALERRNVWVKPHILFMPADLTEAEKVAWEEENTSSAALAAAGVPSNAQVIVVVFFGPKDRTPTNAPGAPR